VKGLQVITTTNPATGVGAETGLQETAPGDVEILVARARAAASLLEALGREGRARALESIALALEAARDHLVSTAVRETGLSAERLRGEISRCTFQFRLFAEAVREGSYVEASVDHARETPIGPGPDLRRMLLPMGPVAIFGASNFPFAFSVAGGDTASALASGCPVLIKAHDSHPLTSLKSFEAIGAALSAAGAPEGSAALVFGQDAGLELITHPSIRAVTFTGSLSTGKTLLDVINRREEPIPFYGELSSVNPLVVTPGAAAARPEEIAQGLFTSVTGSGGQLCTKPGIAFVPSGGGGDRMVSTLSSLVHDAAGQVLLNERIATSYRDIVERLLASGAEVVAKGVQPSGDGFVVAPMLLGTKASDVGGGLAEECFGPLVIVARYESMDEVGVALGLMPPSLAATIHAGEGEEPLVAQLAKSLTSGAGRLVFDGYPTGVRVSWAQHHGGPWPSTNSQHSSVGVTAIRRFLRPFAWQNAPESVLPEELRETYDQIPRRIDGHLVLPSPR
jgi:NADP-dependent aldehyde dehydrogenase